MSVAFHQEADRRKAELNMTTANVGSMIASLEQRLAALEAEIRADKEGVEAFGADLGRLEKRKAELERENASADEFCRQFDAQIGPFESRYAVLRTSIGGLYDEAKSKHAAGLQLLVDKFRYHPAFRRWSDDFTASPFRPK